MKGEEGNRKIIFKGEARGKGKRGEKRERKETGRLVLRGTEKGERGGKGERGIREIREIERKKEI